MWPFAELVEGRRAHGRCGGVGCQVPALIWAFSSSRRLSRLRSAACRQSSGGAGGSGRSAEAPAPSRGSGRDSSRSCSEQTFREGCLKRFCFGVGVGSCRRRGEMDHSGCAAEMWPKPERVRLLTTQPVLNCRKLAETAPETRRKDDEPAQYSFVTWFSNALLGGLRHEQLPLLCVGAGTARAGAAGWTAGSTVYADDDENAEHSLVGPSQLYPLYTDGSDAGDHEPPLRVPYDDPLRPVIGEKCYGWIGDFAHALHDRHLRGLYVLGSRRDECRSRHAALRQWLVPGVELQHTRRPEVDSHARRREADMRGAGRLRPTPGPTRRARESTGLRHL